MDLPTYTNIWRIEKRLYKLYDLRLPMPLPVVWIGVFVGVSVPWWLFLLLVRLPLEAPWHVVYLVPPGVLTWLSTRPVIENKRLTELLQSQVRYMAEPKTWCRMAPFDEPDEIALTGRVWRTTPPVVTGNGRAALRGAGARARRPISVKAAAAPETAHASGASARAAAAHAGGPPLDPSRVVRPAVAAAAAAAVPVTTGSPAPLPWSGAVAAAKGDVTGERVFSLPQPSAPPADPARTADPERDRHPDGPPAGREDSTAHDRAIHDTESQGQGQGQSESQGWGWDRRAPGASPTASESHSESHSEPHTESHSGTHPVPPLGTETLRRLRRLAASAEPRSVRPADPAFFTPDRQDSDRHDPDRQDPDGERAGDPPAASAVREIAAGTAAETTTGSAADTAPEDAPRAASERDEATRQHGTAPGESAEARPPAAPVASAASDAPAAPAASESADDESADAEPAASEPAASDSGTGRSEAPARREDADVLAQHRRGRPPRLVRPREQSGASGEAFPAAAQAQTPPDRPADNAADIADVPESAESADGTTTGPVRTGATAAAGPANTDINANTNTSAGTDADPAGEVSAPVAQPIRIRPPYSQPPAAHRSEPQPPGGRPGDARPDDAQPGAGHREGSYGLGPGPVGPTGKGSVTPPAGPAGVPIRTVPAGPRHAAPSGARPALPAAGSPSGRPGHEEPPRLRRVEAVVGRDPSGGWRRLAQVVVGGSRTDGMEVDEARARVPLTTSRRIMVLGCTGGAGQTTTALMLGHTLARYRDDRVLALDANTGEGTLTTRIAAESPETLSSLLEGSEEVTGYLGMRSYTTRCESGLEVVGADTDDRVTQRLAERAFLADWRRTLAALDRHYRLTVIDPAAALAARLLPYADQLVLVAPASEDASEAVAMTYEWLDGHGCSDLRRRAVMVINGVSRRSLPDVEQAEAVASGRCRAIVRIPWEDELAPGRPGPVDITHLRTGGRRAYVALAGVIVNGLAAAQAKQEVAR
ncbi:TcpE family conjugal transfer membrane protein [Microbispora sp. H10885]|uniref:TcpE family conjugal transfer membrane protein n=1 Tax=Microbispora sp. H10885 TaxID=2729110 RepID=UPI001603D50C|nr:TcpE family conjugal transfer membrane protein [Microbispora sp. H10885]